ncbi:prepilin peptidase [Lacrimispora amygdalina]|jgi:leader peptidase (prepilin peptidase)/N-methyltransferase|uniref:prepilin peptidase n=1 Tax=Lacrimispora amygdalina TaxID=253257 RepID=UPI000BE2A6F6|nr:prepilin peptidase [Lacrimispora amygdalina]
MNGIIVTAVLTGISCLVGFFIPELSYSFACYKCRRKGYPGPIRIPGLQWKTVSLIFTAGITGLSRLLLPFDQAIFTILICYIAAFGICVDRLIRIIANEMLWVILAAGLIYRIHSGGLIGLMGSAGAMALVIAIFGLTMIFTYVRKGTAGVGMGDVKLAMIIAITVGFPGVFYFLTGMACVIGFYCVAGIKYGFLVRESTFPMCGHIMAGFLIALLWPYISITIL